MKEEGGPMSNLAKRWRGVDVSVSDSGHSDHHPVESGWDWCETRILSSICHQYSLSSKKSWKYFFNLDEVGEACKDDATDKDEEDQEK